MLHQFKYKVSYLTTLNSINKPLAHYVFTAIFRLPSFRLSAFDYARHGLHIAGVTSCWVNFTEVSRNFCLNFVYSCVTESDRKLGTVFQEAFV